MNAVFQIYKYDYTATKAEMEIVRRYQHNRDILQSNPALGIDMILGATMLDKDLEEVFAQ